MSVNGNSVNYQTPIPYTNMNTCKAEFTCPDDKAIGYTVERFDIESEGTDRLGMCNPYIMN